jgi:hypothetical protein
MRVPGEILDLLAPRIPLEIPPWSAEIPAPRGCCFSRDFWVVFYVHRLWLSLADSIWLLRGRFPEEVALKLGQQRLVTNIGVSQQEDQVLNLQWAVELFSTSLGAYAHWRAYPVVVNAPIVPDVIFEPIDPTLLAPPTWRLHVVSPDNEFRVVELPQLLRRIPRA